MEKINLNSDELEKEDFNISLSIVNNYKNNDFSYYYQIFDLKRPVENIGNIGVKTNDQFAIKINNNQNIDIAYSVYLDGVNVLQHNGIFSLSDIRENERDEYEKHRNKLIHKGEKVCYVNRYNQKNQKNRSFVFTNTPNTGINENLIYDNSKISRIEVYFWMDKLFDENSLSLDNLDLDSIDDEPKAESESKMKVGAGNETYKGFKEVKGLENPIFLGKLTIVYVDEKFINGKCKIKKNGEFDFDDPMDSIPKP